MSLEALLGIHEIEVLEATIERKGFLAIDSYSPIRTVPCRVIPMTVSMREELARQKQIRASHKIRFSEDPGVIDERHRVKWNGIEMRVTSVPYNAHGLDRIWTMYAEALSRDNQSQDDRISGATVG